MSSLKLNKQITIGYAIMLILMLLIGGFSIYSIFKLSRAASNIEGRYETLSSILSDNEEETQGYLANQMLVEAVKISDEQLKFAYIIIFTMVGVALLFGGILTIIVPRIITKPVFQLVNAAKAVASGDYSYRVKNLMGSIEISMLMEAFNNMLMNIEHNKNELEKKNEENLKLLESIVKFNEVLEDRIEEATKEIKEKQEELIQSEKLAIIGELATGIAHEIRNPLSGIAIALEIMKDETKNIEHKQTCKDILKEIDRLDRIIRELLQLGHPSDLNLIECSPNEIVDRALSLINIKAKQKGIIIEKRLKCMEHFFLDYEQIEQVILNLLLNGIESINGLPAKLTIETGVSNGFLKISISDTGSGLSEDDKEKIFRPYYTTKDRGTGLGLSITNRIVETHKGKIIVTSEKEKGSTFTILIPSNLRS
ncbi:MAG: PAS domain-containing sensor histidine kinase [Thermodesulfobacteriota bacterium]